MTEIAFTVYGTPQSAGSKRPFRNKYTGRIVNVDSNTNAAPWKLQVADRAAEAMRGRELLRGPLMVHFVFYFKRPQAHFGAKGLKPKAPPFPIGRPDALKCARGVEDALSGVVYHDDAQIVREILEKQYGTPERVEIMVCPLASQVAELPVAEQTSLLHTEGAEAR